MSVGRSAATLTKIILYGLFREFLLHVFFLNPFFTVFVVCFVVRTYPVLTDSILDGRRIMTQQRSARVITTIGRLILISIVGCGPASQQPVRLADAQHPNDDVSADSKKIVPPIPPEKAPDPSPRLGDENLKDRIFQPIESYFEGNHGNRSYLQLDKPLYRPGETVWFRSFTLSNRSLAGVCNRKHG